MSRRTEILACLVVMVGVATRSGGQEPLVVNVWPGDGRPPGDPGARGEEHFREPWSEDSKGIRWLTAVSKPTLTVYRPAREKDTGAAVVVCPGGGYWNLAWDLEGEEVAAWLNSLGVTGIILKYRVRGGRVSPSRSRRRGRRWMPSGRSASSGSMPGSGASTRIASEWSASRPAGTSRC